MATEAHTQAVNAAQQELFRTAESVARAAHEDLVRATNSADRTSRDVFREFERSSQIMHDNAVADHQMVMDMHANSIPDFCAGTGLFI